MLFWFYSFFYSFIFFVLFFWAYFNWKHHSSSGPVIVHPHSTTFYKSGWVGWIPPPDGHLLYPPPSSLNSLPATTDKMGKKGRDTFSNNLIFVLFFPRVSPDLFIRTWMFSFIFFLLVFFNRFYLHRLSVAFGRFSFWPWNKKENDYVSKKEVEGVECVRPWPILSAKWFISRLYKCLKTACFEGFFFSLFLSESIVDEFTSEMESLPFHGYWL